ncbi:prephenate dehydrogenase [Thermosediminibacter oceani]|uniref:Prephenate dehydrogenase n=1 Tax=Thermosediminibacter oceani (strain ATCC BAA-1034 / DSM 16646 / JW/IW-1228P) TaxID=555079 RepID=D9S1W7_THEOJ|nr:prephenate dehydrogenase/arogenate dehydrogenase family protein [Thermosediminibacter oceani]ADL07394.1 Prephenate dehydrogenase [Thermosediminibacter oceani DSM 16646]
MSVSTVAVVGLGIIGGSLARAFKAAGLEVLGIDSDDGTLSAAASEGVVSEDSFNINSADESSFRALKRADIIFICTPVLSIVPVVKRLAPFIKRGAVVTDTGSTKRVVVNSVKEVLPEGVAFVGGHPMAGSQYSGYGFSRADLFSKSPYILTPAEETPLEAVETLKALVFKIGAVPHIMTPEEHDGMAAAVSHLPQVIATSLVNAVRESDTSGEYLKLAGRGYKDTTRIASSAAGIWIDILLTNRDEVLNMISIFKKQLGELQRAIEASSAPDIKRIFERAREYGNGRNEDFGCDGRR